MCTRRYCREAMVIDHVFQHTMWDLTDELIQAHTAVFKKSIFSDCSLLGSRVRDNFFLSCEFCHDFFAGLK